MTDGDCVWYVNSSQPIKQEISSSKKKYYFTLSEQRKNPVFLLNHYCSVFTKDADFFFRSSMYSLVIMG